MISIKIGLPGLSKKNSPEEALKTEFRRRKPWITKFIIDGKEYGGEYDARNDRRIDQFFQYFPAPHIILELGSLEGGHTFRLAAHPRVEKVIGIEGREANVDKARFVQGLLNINNVEFARANLESVDLSSFGKFDAVFCVGLLYHLPEPWKLIEHISTVSSNIFLWTHYAKENKADKIENVYRGMMYREGGLVDPLSGLSSRSFWPTLDSLADMLKMYGFKNIHYIEDNSGHPNGPCITLAASVL